MISVMKFLAYFIFTGMFLYIACAFVIFSGLIAGSLKSFKESSENMTPEQKYWAEIKAQGKLMSEEEQWKTYFAYLQQSSQKNPS